ncbi:transcriptional regulator [Pseudomonas sp. GOM7]|uniref:transcriptional regulator n=1 Tax=unclassified Pseudomonas TaxID=196821 RepID=UPI00227C98BD|nr:MULTISPECIES: transcriptional regulator [unclassified Pseudomonas]WAJ35608.1 transcriptional regulator [Pseudomonas sp. GOM7]
MSFHWDLIERLLHEAQNSAGQPFAPRRYAEELAEELSQAGKGVDDLDHFRAEATHYEASLLKGDFIAPRPESEGGNGENFVLTTRGAQLLSLLDSSIPGSERPREVLDQAGEAALTPEVFDRLAQEATLGETQ